MTPLTPFMNRVPITNPMMQRLAMINQAMKNPLSIVKQRFPDIPDQLSNDPNAILNYLQQTRGITDQDLQQLYATYGMR